MKQKLLYERKQRRARRTRAGLHGTKEMPRLSVFRSNKYIYAQLIDDDAMKTLAAVSSKDAAAKKSKTDAAKIVGAEIAKKAKELKIGAVVFDRGSYRYHGRVRALAEAARESGLKI